MIYLDNAATTYPKPDIVYNKMDYFLRNNCANPGRGGHKLSIDAAKEVYNARDIIGELFNIKNKNRIVFTKNSTEALNIAIFGLLKKGDHVITSSMEHNSVIRPLMMLKKDRTIELSIVKCNNKGYLNIEDIQNQIQSNTKLICITHSSNVNGIVMPIKEIGKLTKEKNIIFLLDSAQTAGVFDINVEINNIGLLTFSGHKSLFGPQGVGGLFIAEGINLKAFILGGTGTNSESFDQPSVLPDMFESGTLNTPGIVGLRHGVEFINNIGLHEIQQHKKKLLEEFASRIEGLNNIILYSDIKNLKNNSGIIALNFDGIDSTELSYILDKCYNISTRAGLHCAPLAHETLNTKRHGIVRFSFSYLNTLDDVEKTYLALKEISKSVTSNKQ